VLAEHAAGGEDGLDGVDDDARWGEGEVACVVLWGGVVLVGAVRRGGVGADVRWRPRRLA
jgi:hypothetical protein